MPIIPLLAASRGGPGGGGGGGGVSFLLRQAGTTDRGLLFSARGADETWHLRGEDKRDTDPPIGGHVDLPSFAGVGVARHGSLRLQFPADISGFEGVLSNNIVVRLSRDDSISSNPTVTWTPSQSRLEITVGRNTEISQVRTAIDNASLGFTLENTLTGAAIGSDRFVLPPVNNNRADYNVTGGRDAIQPGIELLAQPEDAVDGPNILARYDPLTETLQDLLDELEENDQGVTITIPYGTDLTARPEPVPFLRGWQAGIADPAPLFDRTLCEEIVFTDQTANVGTATPVRLAIPDQTVSVEFPRGGEPAIFTDLNDPNNTVVMPRGVISMNFSAIADATGNNGEGSIQIFDNATDRIIDTLGPFSIPGQQPTRVQHTLTLCLEESAEVYFFYNTEGRSSLLTDMVMRAAIWGRVDSDAVEGSGLTEAQVRDLVRTLVKGYTLRGGPVVPDSEIDQTVLRENEVKPYALRDGPIVPESDIDPDIARDSEIKNFARVGGPAVPEAEIDPDIARDSEVPGLLSAALTDRAPGAGRNDRIPFRTRDGAWSDATSETWRELFTSYVGNWTNLSGTPGFIFRQGDLVDENGILYWLNAETRLDGDISPEVGPTYTPLNSWSGAWSDKDYKAGSVTTDRAGLYLATQNVSRGDPRPSSHGTANKWVRIDDGRSLLYGGAWSSTAAFRNHTILQHTNPAPATYVTLRDVEAGIEPGVTADWETSYARLGWSDGAPDSVTGITYDGDTSEIVTTQRGGHVTRDRIATGGTNVTANPSGQDGVDLTRIAIGGINYNTPRTGYSFYTRPAVTTPAVTGSIAANQTRNVEIVPVTQVNDPVFRDQDITTEFTGEINLTSSTNNASLRVQVETTISFAGGTKTVVLRGREREGPIIRNAPIPIFLDRFSDFDAVPFGSFTDANGDTVTITEADLAGGFTIQFELMLRGYNTQGTQRREIAITAFEYTDIGVRLFQIPHGTGPAYVPPTPRPQISSFTLTSGDQTPVAGSLAGETYGVAWAIAQSDHVGAARIIGFKGAFDAANATVLATIAEGDYAHGARDVVTPAGLNLADGEMYSLRLQVYGEGVTNPALDAVPDGYQDIRIVAHVQARANYHTGHIVYASADADGAATLARIVDFSGDSETGTDLPSRLTIDVPVDSNHYQLYLLAKSDEPQPSAFTSDGLPATASFYPGQSITLSGITFTAYILRPGQRVNSDDNGDFFGVVA